MNWIKKILGVSRSRDSDVRERTDDRLVDLELPRITQKHVHRVFGAVDYTEPVDDQGPTVEDGITYWDDKEYAEAYAVFKEAMEGGPNDYDRSCLDCLLGQLEVMKNDLHAAVHHFTACLANRERADDYTWEAARRLAYIYQAAGRYEEEQRLLELANYINEERLERPVTHTASVRAAHQDLVWRVMKYMR